jgi:phenylalanyl-tRNA synthetase alpha chain
MDFFLKGMSYMQETINNLKKEIQEKLSSTIDLKNLNELKNIYLSKKGPVQELMNHMKELGNEEKKEFGRIINEFKTEVTNSFDKLKKDLEEQELNRKLESESIDISLPSTKVNVGSANILEKLIEEVEDVFISMGYDVVDGPEIELDKYNFEMLNIPKGHPARDAQDTFYLEGEEILLRSQTSPVQVRTLLKGEGKNPIRMICPGKTYRRDDDDATHSHQFMQIEGLVVDKEISLSDLKGTLDVVFKKLFGENTETRFHPSYYQFTEPSVEVDITCHKCHGKGCNICKNSGWITIAGAGIVHPNVLKMSGYDPNVWTGFAFGFGADRLAMEKYDIHDLRAIYNTDLRETKTFDRKERD